MFEYAQEVRPEGTKMRFQFITFDRQCIRSSDLVETNYPQGRSTKSPTSELTVAETRTSAH
jgi:hypothetical protein